MGFPPVLFALQRWRVPLADSCLDHPPSVCLTSNWAQHALGQKKRQQGGPDFEGAFGGCVTRSRSAPGVPKQLRWRGIPEPADPRVLLAGMMEGRLHPESSALWAMFLQWSTPTDKVQLSSVRLLQKHEKKCPFFLTAAEKFFSDVPGQIFFQVESFCCLSHELNSLEN